MPNFKQKEKRIWYEEKEQPEKGLRDDLFHVWVAGWGGLSGEPIHQRESETLAGEDYRKETRTQPLNLNGEVFQQTDDSLEVVPFIINGQFGGVLIGEAMEGNGVHVPYYILHEARELFPQAYEDCKAEGLPFAFYFLGIVKAFIVGRCVKDCVVPHPVEVCQHDIPI